MQNNLDILRFSLRPNATRVWSALFAVLIMCLCAAGVRAGAQTKQDIVVSQVVWLNPLQGVGAESGSAGALSSADAAGTTFAVNSNGDVILSNEYGNQILLFNGQTGAVTVLGTYANPGPVTIDSKDNLYVGGLYTNVVVKVPYVNGTYPAITPSSVNPNNGALLSPSPCKGGDTTECGFGFSSDGKTNYLDSAANGYYFGVLAMAFDSAGDFFYGMTNANTAPNAIFECDVKCLASGGDAPKLIFQEPTSATPATTGQLNIGSMAFDPWGDLFFTDSSLTSTGSNESVTSNLNELVSTAGTLATKPTVIQTFTNASPGSYDDELDAVAVDSNGTVYYATQFDGVWAYPNASGVVDTSAIYGISNQGAKLLQVTPKGELYIAAYSTAIASGGADTLARISVDSLSAPGVAVGQSSTAANVTVMDNNGAGCTTPPVITFTASETGKASTEFAAVVTPPTGKATTTCATQTAGSDFPVTVTFTPTNAGERVAVLSATDGTNNGSATASAVGQGPLVTLDPGVWTSFTTGFSGPTDVAVDGLGDVAVADTASNKVFRIPSGSSTPVAISTITPFSGPEGVAYDANGDLFIADTGNNQIIEIPNVSGSVDGSNEITVVADTVLFGGTALNGPAGLAFGPHGVLYIADTGNDRVVTFNPANGLGAVRVTSASAPAGIAVDAAGILYVAYTGTGSVTVYQGGGVTTSLSPSGITTPGGVAVDASGSLLVSDLTTGKVVRIPNEAGTLTATDAITIETNPMSGAGIALDTAGDLITADTAGKAVYWIQRTAASLNLGSVDDDATGEETLYVESAGNTALTLGNPIFTAPTNSMFSLAAGAPVGCSSSFKGKAGTVCELTATFAPPNATAAGPQTGTSAIASNALNAASATVNLNGTAVFEDLIAQVITFTKPKSPVAFGVKPISLVATGGASGNPVVFSVVSGPATVSGSTLTITGVGTVVVAANQAGNSTYSAAAQVTVTIVVTKAPQIIHFPAPVTGPITFDKVKTIALHATATSDLTVKFSVASGPGTIKGDTLTITGAGTIDIFAKQGGNADYLAAVPVKRDVVVNKASQKITFTTLPSTVAYGIKPITLKATSTSKLLVKFSVLSGPATIKGDLLSIDGAGTVVVAAGQSGNVDFDAAPQVKQTIKVDKAQLIVAANNLTMKQGAAVPTLTHAITGFVNKDTQKTSTTGKPVLTTTATSSSPVGKYPIDITLGTLKSSDYSFKFADGKLTVQ